MTVHLFHSTTLKSTSAGYNVRDYHPTCFLSPSVFKNSCVTDSPPLPLLLWPLILQSSWISSREGKYSLHLPPELCVLLTLEQSLATKNRLPTPNFAVSSRATTAFWHSVLLGGSHAWSLPPCRGWQKHSVSPKSYTGIPMTRLGVFFWQNKPKQRIGKIFHMTSNTERMSQNYRLVATRNGNLIVSARLFLCQLRIIPYGWF